jgi:hypothetical protein
VADNGKAVQGIGAAASSIFGAIGDFAEAGAYQQAANLSGIEAGYASENTRIQEAQAQRKLYQVEGAAAAKVGGAGLAMGGSNLDIMRSSAQQGALNKQLIQTQGNINVAGYQQQEESYHQMSVAANNAGLGGIVSGVVDALGVIAAPFTGGLSLAAASAINGGIAAGTGDSLGGTLGAFAGGVG